ncbi:MULTISPECIES: SagB/ThcOx family dehydrogenase [unclassified Paraburkholderia]|uniref:SagB/ThcOx family dehydrogenase n=1 Tax=unclassified Paraburkholderia TaxID=2615204 RepID=UPI001617F56B|nr:MULTISPECIES: SagB/ThcOx family dehydrogenase [unclassified Paraburkholderia]MBB5447202.1 SagB-type dehydrogenase family enzyme [Paraburkholderia sp. WSM4177]MBB5487694.1 SagB-type dehydrogenase family enzyme [Paraburkholderia sp. WSM4180]
MKRRELLVALAAGALAEGSTGLAQASQAKFTGQIDLPKPNLKGTMSLEEAIEKRRSVRRFAPKPLPVEAIGQLLWAGQGITSSDGKRAAPAAGALYALELYVVAPTEVMHYLPDGHRVETRATHDLRPELRALAVNQASVEAAPALLVVAADPSRLTARYGGRANLYADLEVAHATQNMLLQVVTLGLVAVTVGAVDGAPAARKLGLPHGQTVVYLIPVGFPV